MDNINMFKRFKSVLSASQGDGGASTTSSTTTTPTKATATNTSTGLYGFKQLTSPQGFQHMVDDAIESCEKLIDFIPKIPSSAETIRAMDEILDTLNSVKLAAVFCINTHSNRNFIEEARRALITINEYQKQLYSNRTLFAASKRAEQDGHLLSEEARIAAQCFCKIFKDDGIEKLDDRVNQLMLDCKELCTEFEENIRIDPGHIDIYPASRVPNDMHYLFKPMVRCKSGTPSTSSWSGEKGVRLKTDTVSLNGVLNLVPNDEVGKLAYIEGKSAPRENIKVLLNLIAARHELAQILRYRSYAHMKQKLISSPEVITSFLHELSSIVKPKADQEFDALRNFKRQKSYKKSIGLEPWDETYYRRMMESSAHNLEDISSYFSLPQCLEGLKVLANSLFGITVCNVPMAPGESWHPSVLKMSFHHPKEGDLGYLYLDLYSRKKKLQNTCAHYSIKRGRRISETKYQNPVSAITCDFSESKVVRLNHWDVQSLFHEFGHALHALLSRKDYQYFSGPATVALDLVEIPSLLFEYYAWDYRFLKTFAKHYATGEVIPEKLVKSMKDARDMFAASDLRDQIFLALVDETLFGEQPAGSSQDLNIIVSNLERQYTNRKHVEGTHWYTQFSHLTGYGASYYTYLYGKCFAATIWKRICQEDPLSLATGTALRTKLLQHGGDKQPIELLNNVFGERSLPRDYIGEIVPGMTCLLDELGLKMSRTNISAGTNNMRRKSCSKQRSKQSKERDGLIFVLVIFISVLLFICWAEYTWFLT